MEQSLHNHAKSIKLELQDNSPKSLHIRLTQKDIEIEDQETKIDLKENGKLILPMDINCIVKQESSDSEKTDEIENDMETFNSPFTDEKLTLCLTRRDMKSNSGCKRKFKKKRRPRCRKKKNQDRTYSSRHTRSKEGKMPDSSKTESSLDNDSVIPVSIKTELEDKVLDSIKEITVESVKKKTRESIPRKIRLNTSYCQDSYDENEDLKPAEEVECKQQRVRVKKYSCEICGKRFVSENILKSHYHSHAGEKRFKCVICGKEYGWPSSYQIHMQTHNGDDAHKCHICGKVLCSKVTLQRHITRMHLKPEKTFACDICNRTFMYGYELKYHKEKHFSKQEFICEFCGKILANKNYLTAHLRTHTGEKPFVCSICNKGFTWKSLMKQHMKIHVDGYCYQCEICGKQYSAQRSLARHFLLHTDERPYKCKLCEKAFKCGSALASHKDYHLGIKRHKCEFCGKAFLSESNMHKHKKRHIGIKNHNCNLCEKAFITKQELQMHMRSHSGNKNNKRKTKTAYMCDLP